MPIILFLKIFLQTYAFNENSSITHMRKRNGTYMNLVKPCIRKNLVMTARTSLSLSRTGS
jgi:hypothetical protein